MYYSCKVGLFRVYFVVKIRFVLKILVWDYFYRFMIEMIENII